MSSLFHHLRGVLCPWGHFWLGFLSSPWFSTSLPSHLPWKLSCFCLKHGASVPLIPPHPRWTTTVNKRKRELNPCIRYHCPWKLEAAQRAVIFSEPQEYPCHFILHSNSAYSIMYRQTQVQNAGFRALT